MFSGRASATIGGGHGLASGSQDACVELAPEPFISSSRKRKPNAKPHNKLGG